VRRNPFRRLRTLRKKLADERRVPAYVVFGDATLRQMAREYPTTDDALADISGLGVKKRAEFGPAFAARSLLTTDEFADQFRLSALSPCPWPALFPFPGFVNEW